MTNSTERIERAINLVNELKAAGQQVVVTRWLSVNAHGMKVQKEARHSIEKMTPQIIESNMILEDWHIA